MRKAELLNAPEFWSAFKADLPGVRSRLIIHSPFLHPRRLADGSRLFSSLKDRGVSSCLTTQSVGAMEEPLPEDLKSDYEQNRTTSLDILRSWRFHLNARRFHHKFVLIDKRVMYFGSMNVFSHFNTSECMRRTEDPDEIEEACEKFDLDYCEECMKQNNELWGNSTVNAPMTQFGVLLRKQRLRLKLSQVDLERLSGVPHQTIGAMERGKNCHMDAFLSVFKALDLKLAVVPEDTAAAVLNITRSYWNEVPTLDPLPEKRTPNRSKKSGRETSSIIIAPTSNPTIVK